MVVKDNKNIIQTKCKINIKSNRMNIKRGERNVGNKKGAKTPLKFFEIIFFTV